MLQKKKNKQIDTIFNLILFIFITDYSTVFFRFVLLTDKIWLKYLPCYKKIFLVKKKSINEIKTMEIHVVFKKFQIILVKTKIKKNEQKLPHCNKNKKQNIY